MSDSLVNRLLGRDRDPGCEACFEILDQYAEAVIRDPDAARRFPEIVAHLAGCSACREDTEGLIAALRSTSPEEFR